MKMTKSLVVGLGLMLGQLLAAPAMANIIVSVQPSASQQGPGGTFSVNIVAAGLQSGMNPDQIIRVFDLALGYDPTVLTPVSAVYDNYPGGGGAGQLPGPNATGSYLNLAYPLGSFQLSNPTFNLAANGYTVPGFTVGYEFSELSNRTDAELIANQPDSFILATLSFQVAADTEVKFTDLALIDSRFRTGGGPSLDIKGIGNEILTDRVTLVNGTVHIPEPGTLALLLGGGLVAVLRRRQAAKAA